jgi:Na+-transporting NADH:ubiquinone oxidoreductase subunit NqrD
VVTSALAVAHIGLLALWLGSMLYSLLIVQPRAARFFAADDDTLEEFLTVLGSGNRRPVVGIVVALFITGGALVAAIDPTANQAGLFATEGILLLVAAAVFARVSWRLWPRRVFALPDERPAHRRALHGHALAMVTLVGAAFVLTVLAVTLPG